MSPGNVYCNALPPSPSVCVYLYFYLYNEALKPERYCPLPDPLQ